ncbi:type VI secretion system contractile sheath large subunit, partial [Enterobacter hormaechei]|nr:type VI secretion system contractile sheath large subunit [Enterobacter hormaechei]
MAQHEENSTAIASGATTSLLDEIMSQARMTPENDGYYIAKQGVAAFIGSILDTGSNEEPINKLLVDKMIVELDKKLSQQMDEIVHANQFQELESSWRSLKILVDRTDFRENIKINILHATKDELLEDFEFSPEIIQSGFYKHVYST